jgi:hypothetical protein
VGGRKFSSIPVIANKNKVLFFFDMANNIFHLTIQCITQRIEGFGTDGFSFFDAVERVG